MKTTLLYNKFNVLFFSTFLALTNTEDIWILNFPVQNQYYGVLFLAGKFKWDIFRWSGFNRCLQSKRDQKYIVWKLLKMSHLNFWILTFSTNFCPIRTDLSGNTVWPQASGFLKTRQIGQFSAFLINFCPLKM